MNGICKQKVLLKKRQKQMNMINTKHYKDFEIQSEDI